MNGLVSLINSMSLGINAISHLVANAVILFLISLILIGVFCSVGARAKNVARNIILASVVGGGYMTFGTDVMAYINPHIDFNQIEQAASLVDNASAKSDYDL